MNATTLAPIAAVVLATLAATLGTTCDCMDVLNVLSAHCPGHEVQAMNAMFESNLLGFDWKKVCVTGPAI